MIVEQADLFRQTSKDFVKAVMEVAVKESHEGGEVLFRRGEEARDFYILLKGQVKLALGEAGHVVHTVSRGGECFGWSSLVGRDSYSASAECVGSTKLLKIGRDVLQPVLEKDLANGLLFFKGLARAVGERLVTSYSAFLFAQPTEAQTSYGSSQTLGQRASEG